MFAILLSENMDPFYQNASSFPTVFFTFFLLLSVFFWAIAVLGLVDIGILDVMEIDGGVIDIEGEGTTIPDGVAGIILKLGLNGVPVTVVVTFMSMIGWFFSYYFVYFLEVVVPAGPIMWLLNVVIFAGSFAIAVVLTAQIIKPLRKLFKGMTQQHTPKVLLGQMAKVRTSRVDENFGEAELSDGGAGLILKVRCEGFEQFKRGDEVVLFEYNRNNNTYRVISITDFKKL